MRRKKAEHQDGTGAAAGGRVTPGDVQQIEFRLAFRGYHERDVDAFLDRVTEDLAWYMEENQRLRAAGIAVAAASPDDLAQARAQADAIIADARAEAADIVRRAEQQAGAIVGAGTGDPRAAVAPFLNMEREFLQGLGALVQTHAEEVKQMVLELRARTDRARGDAGTEPEPAAPTAGAEPASAEEIRERLGEPGSPSEPEPELEPDPVIVDVATEPAYSSEGAPAGDGRERSLRELFWGDE